MSTDTDLTGPARRLNFAARCLVNDHAILTGGQRKRIVDALDSDARTIAEQRKRIEQLERDLADVRAGWDTALDLGEQACEMLPDPPTGHAEFAAEVRRLAAQRHRAQAEQLTRERDQARAQRDKAVHQLGQVTDQLVRVRADRDEAKGLTNSLITARDKANHRYRVEKTRADRLGRDRAWFEHQLNQIRAFVAPPATDDDPEPNAETRAAVREVRAEAMRHIRAGDEDAADEVLGAGYRRLFSTNNPPASTNGDTPGDSWTEHVHERQDLARKLRESPGRVVRVHNTGPVPATPSAIGHSPSLHMLGACPCQAGTPFDPDYTEADLGPQEG